MQKGGKNSGSYMDKYKEFADTMSFTAAEFALGRQKCRNWPCLITQQLRLRHVYQIYAYNLPEDQKATHYFTLHNTPMSSPIYTSERLAGKHPKWGELHFSPLTKTNLSSVVIRLWKTTKNGDEILLTWGVNFSGLVYLGNKITDLQPKHFQANTVIFFMQGVYFTSQAYLRTDVGKSAPFQKNLNLIETAHGEQVLYRRMAVKAPKGEVSTSYTVEKLRRLQQLQRQINSMKIDVQDVKERIRRACEREPEVERTERDVRYAPQLLTMTSLNKMLHEKPTKVEREAMTGLNRNIEVCKFRLRLLYEERDKMSSNLRRLKQMAEKLAEENEERNSNLMSLYHVLHKESRQWGDYKQGMSRLKEYALIVSEQLWLRQHDLMKELLFIYPIDKLTNENKYSILGIHLPDSDLLVDCQDAGVSVVLGYVCHVLVLCSIFLQVPLRHPMKHFGSRSVIYDQVYPDILEKEREFPLYTKGRDRAHFSYAVFLLNKNISQLRLYLHHKMTVDLRETLKNLRSFLLGDDLTDTRPRHLGHLGNLAKKDRSLTASDMSASLTLTVDSVASVDRLSVSSLSSSNLNDPLLDRINEAIRRDRQVPERLSGSAQPKKSFGIFTFSPRRSRKEPTAKGSSEALAVPEAYLSRQISQELFHRCASGRYIFEDKESGISDANGINVGQGIEEVSYNGVPTSLAHSDSIEEGTDPLDPSANIDPLVPTPPIDIGRTHANENSRISRSVDSYVIGLDGLRKPSELMGSDPTIKASCDSSFKDVPAVANDDHLLGQWISGDPAMLSAFPQQECLRMSLQDASSPLSERTDRLLSGNQSFNLVRHRPLD